MLQLYTKVYTDFEKVKSIAKRSKVLPKGQKYFWKGQKYGKGSKVGIHYFSSNLIKSCKFQGTIPCSHQIWDCIRPSCRDRYNMCWPAYLPEGEHTMVLTAWQKCTQPEGNSLPDGWVYIRSRAVRTIVIRALGLIRRADIDILFVLLCVFSKLYCYIIMFDAGLSQKYLNRNLNLCYRHLCTKAVRAMLHFISNLVYVTFLYPTDTVCVCNKYCVCIQQIHLCIQHIHKFIY